MYANGELPASILTTVAPGMILRRTTAVAYRNVVKLADLLLDDAVIPAGKYGAGYRDLTAMGVFYRASLGSVVDMAKAGIDRGLKVSVAKPPNSSHAQATRADILFNHATPSGAQVALLGRCGWSREFGMRDVNHWMHDGVTFAVSEADINRVVCRYLNRRHLGQQSDTENDGLWPAKSKYTWMIQTAGRADGLYPTPYQVDGERGPKTITVRDHYWRVLWNS